MFTKKLRSYSVVIISTFCLLLINCSAVISPLPVGIYSNTKFPVDYESGYNGDQEYNVLGTAVGKATATSILGLFATGDASIASAYQNAINQFPEADCLIEIAIDYSTSSFIGFYGSVTTIVKGKAIQFKKLSFKTDKKKEEIIQKENKKVIVNEEKKEEKAPENLTHKESTKKELEPVSHIQPTLKTKVQ